MMSNKQIWYKSKYSLPDNELIYQSLPNCLYKIAAKSPNSTALISKGKTYSFYDLSCRAAGLSDEINEVNVSPGPVALLVSMGIDSMAAWFACSISGRSFILLEPDHPPKRLVDLISKAGCSLIICDQTTYQIIKDFSDVNILISDGRLGILVPNQGLSSNDPTIIFPTSGSTGSPKLITYSAVTILVKVFSSINLMQIPDNAIVLIAGSHGNYGFLHHALVFLLAEGTICLSDVKVGGFAVVFESIRKYGVRHVRFTPSMFRKIATLPQAIDTLKQLDGIRFSGEPLLINDLKLALSVLKPKCLIQNIYGSTESALFIWSYHLEKVNFSDSTVPIGSIYPLASYAIKPIGDCNEGDDNYGELLISSCFHALGDLINGKINQDRFPLLEGSSNERIYATGDIVRKLPNGHLLHVGRSARMVKIRGHRVFLAEIENNLQSIEGVTNAAIVECQVGDNVILYGFITINSTSFNVEVARIKLAELLPNFMQPRNIEIVSEIPLLPGGKVDYLGLRSKIPKFSINSNANFQHDDNFNRLIHLWDSILWIGAHKYESDFITLGGDSLGLMTLIVEVERIFQKTILINEFKKNSTLRNLASILDINNFQIEIEKNEGLRTGLLLPGKHPSKGIALAMPGVGGWAPAFPFSQAGVFMDLDIWVADYLIKDGTMLQGERWWKAAKQIVENILIGKISTPTVIYGYSMGGGMAWLVSRLLIETNKSPKYVVMVDSIPLHHINSFRNSNLFGALKLVSQKPAPNTLHIRRDSLSNFKSRESSIDLWKKEDNIHKVINMPTVDHIEMINPNLLAIAAEIISDFLDNKPIPNISKPKLPVPNLHGVHIYHALNGDIKSQKIVLAEFNKHPEKFSLDNLIALVLLLHIYKEYVISTKILSYTLEKWPKNLRIQYLLFRIKRNKNMLFYENTPSVYPLVINFIDLNLTKNIIQPVKLKPRFIRLISLSIDILFACINVGLVNFKSTFTRK